MPALGEERSSGVLLHISSLPGRFGIGDLGPAAHHFIGLLHRARIGWWQLLPLNLPGEGDSPYSACSAFAGNIYLISPEGLVADGLLRPDELADAELPAGSVSYARVRTRKDRLLGLAAQRMTLLKRGPLRAGYERFVTEQHGWLDDFALFMAILKQRDGALWQNWPRAIARRHPAALRETARELSKEVETVRIHQYLFFRQVEALRAHAKQHGVKLLGDMPIYVSMQSADVWAAPHLFQLDRAMQPRSVAGVPPDAFSRTGQRWGNPLYDWNAMRADGYEWWIARLSGALSHADVVRIDHFRGLASYWSIPAASRTAVKGRWIKGPGGAFLRAMEEQFGSLPLVAEDLGLITPDVLELRDQFDLAGMQILQFAFDDPAGLNLPHRYVPNLITYTGNHDTDTTVGWYRSLDPTRRKRLHAYAPETADDAVLGLMRLAWASVARLAVVPMQDLLKLTSSARMNVPGRSKNNWRWRLRPEQLTPTVFDGVASLNSTYQRGTATQQL